MTVYQSQTNPDWEDSQERAKKEREKAILDRVMPDGYGVGDLGSDFVDANVSIYDTLHGTKPTDPDFTFEKLDAPWDPRMGEQGQSGVYEQMRQAIMGEGTSVAQQQMQDALSRYRSGAQALSVSNPSVGVGVARRNAINSSAMMGGQANRDMQALRAQEMAGAQGQMANWLAQQKDFEMQDQERRGRENNLMNEFMYKQELLKSQMSSDEGFLGKPADIASQLIGGWLSTDKNNKAS